MIYKYFQLAIKNIYNIYIFKLSIREFYMHISFRQLEIFISVAKLGTVVKASEKIGISQSAASMSLNELEKNLQAPLFVRVGRNLKLTPFGENQLVLAEDILTLGRKFERFGKESTEEYKIHIGASQTIGNYFLPKLMAEFMRANPNIHLEVSFHNSEEVIEKVTQRGVDLGFIESSLDPKNLWKCSCRKDNLIIVASKNNPLTSKKNLVLQDLLEAKWILREKGSGTRDIFVQAMGDYFEQLNVAMNLDQHLAILNLVENSDFLTPVSESIVADRIANGALVKLEVPFLPLSRQWSLIGLPGQIPNEQVKSFIEFLGIKDFYKKLNRFQSRSK